jgi:site-specific recombinase XerC
MHLLQAGIDMAVIALWLGHESIETTHIYVEADLAMKERALERIAPATSSVRVARCSQHTSAFNSRTELHLNHQRMTLPERFARPNGRTKAGPIVEWLYF